MSIIERIIPVFHKNYPLEVRDTIWNDCMANAMQVEINEANLENMGESYPVGTAHAARATLVYGFGGGEGHKQIAKLAEALGVCGISNPENNMVAGCHVSPLSNADDLTLDEILDRTQTRLPFQIDFPAFSGSFSSISTKYGPACNRHIFYLWVLKRVIELCPDPNSSIIEIGAGYGVLGYYLDKVGYRDYTVIDLALVNACQTYFLARNLPDRNIILSGDVENPFDPQYKDSIKLLHSTDFKAVPRDRFSIMVNMDGLTEMGVEEATKYVQHDCAPMLLSINHEVNSYRVCEIEQPLRKLEYRYPFWLREGYVEELYVNK